MSKGLKVPDYSGDGRFIVAMTLAFLRSLDVDARLDILNQAGFSNGEIGSLVGLTQNAVQLRLAKQKKSKKEE
jgi:hypothetical protein